ncbi:Splicing factor YJU2 [Taenia crassiceps]|uniref:Splicing factor YJU2 n=1 Tax=Taenia crassiceps TaxID=6207 RepID=A0ABR4Q0M7_9CEST
MTERKVLNILYSLSWVLRRNHMEESGAKRNFEALKTAEELEAKRAALEEEELANNPMKLLEKRTNQSKYEMETAEAIDDLKEMNKRQATMETDNFLLRKLWQEQEAERAAQEKADEDFIKEVMEAKNKGISPSEIAEKFDPDGQVQGPAARDEAYHVAAPSAEMVSKPKSSMRRLPGSFSTSHRDLIRNAIKKRPFSASLAWKDPEELKRARNSPEPSGGNPLGIAYSSDGSSTE